MNLSKMEIIFQSLAVLLVLIFAGNCQAKTGACNMEGKILLIKGFDFETVTPPPSEPIGSVEAAQPIARAAPEARAGYPRPLANEQLNSRVVRTLPDGTWRVHWEAGLNPRFMPAYVLQEGNRVMVQAGEWRLFDLNGKFIASGRVSDGPIIFDSSHDLFFRVVPEGYLTAGQLGDGKQIFQYLPTLGNTFSRPFISIVERRVILVGLERLLHPDGKIRPSKSTIEVVDMGDPVRADDLGFLDSGFSVGVLQFPSPHMLAAQQGSTLITVIPNHIYIVGLDLKIRASFKDTFEPKFLSLDEIGRLYLIVKSNGGDALWVMTPLGDRLFAYGYPESIPEPVIPPVVGYDHQVYILGRDQIVAVGSTGKRLWSRVTGGGVVGGVVTPDDQLLVSDGSEIIVFDQTGNPRILYSFSGEVLRTPPILTEQGNLLVASDSHIYCLKAEGRNE